jgi:peptidase M50B-like protein
MTTTTRRRVDWGLLGLLIGLFAVVALLWNTPIVYPVKVFVVLLHELSHALMAIATGGHVYEIRISPLLGGVTITVGGSRFLIASAGYLGSILWGGLILFAAARSRHDRALAAAVGGVVIVATLLFTRNLFGLAFGLLFGTALIWAARRLSNEVSDVVLKFLGLTSCLYVVLDIKSDLIDRAFFFHSGAVSDAQTLAMLTGIPALLWGIAWLLIALATLFIFLRAAVLTRA